MPDKPNLYIKDFILYRAVYCSICKSINKTCGTKARLATNYDSVFLSVLLHNYLDIDFTVTKQNCILHPIRRTPMAKPDSLNKDVAAMSVLLMYHKLSDDILDGGGAHKRFIRLAFKKGYKKAKKTHPEFNEVILKQYDALRGLEKQNCDSIDRAADAFATMLCKLNSLILKDKDSENMQRLSYNIGRWIYLADALDDLEKDFKKKNYNPFIASFKDYKNLTQFLSVHKEDLSFCLLTSANAVISELDNITFNFNTDLLNNIAKKGIVNRTNFLLENKKSQKISHSRI